LAPHHVIGCEGIALAARRNWPYLNPMVQPLSSRPLMAAATPQGRVASAIVRTAAGLGAIILLAALALWYHYGTAVFFEMISAGISACF
jgi:hypothetical protein